ncbi:hypothetical protein [Pelagibius sp.]|uniref:hypothetical protein n=1 Tax=Pelagibius sp. TaxID=1931238 RepID=UPI00263A026E|nr:hypothetical protein [Pelagibius sp.]
MRRLEISASIFGALGFGLRHVVAFFVLGLLPGLPKYLHSFLPREDLGAQLQEVWPQGQAFPEGMRSFLLPRPEWETEFAVPLAETFLFGIALAVVVQTLAGDRRGATWSVFSALGAVLRHLPTVLGVSLVCALALATANYLSAVIPYAALPLGLFALFLSVVFCVVIPCAAVENHGMADCIEYSAELSNGSRWRIVAVFVLSFLPIFGVGFATALVLQYAFDVRSLDIAPHWRLVGGALFAVYFLPLMAVIHEALVALKEGPDPGAAAAVFD